MKDFVTNILGKLEKTERGEHACLRHTWQSGSRQNQPAKRAVPCAEDEGRECAGLA